MITRNGYKTHASIAMCGLSLRFNGFFFGGWFERFYFWGGRAFLNKFI